MDCITYSHKIIDKETNEIIYYQENISSNAELQLISLLIDRNNNKKNVKISNFINESGLHEIIVEVTFCIYLESLKTTLNRLHVYHFKGSILERLPLITK